MSKFGGLGTLEILGRGLANAVLASSKLSGLGASGILGKTVADAILASSKLSRLGASGMPGAAALFRSLAEVGKLRAVAALALPTSEPPPSEGSVPQTPHAVEEEDTIARLIEITQSTLNEVQLISGQSRSAKSAQRSGTEPAKQAVSGPRRRFRVGFNRRPRLFGVVAPVGPLLFFPRRQSRSCRFQTTPTRTCSTSSLSCRFRVAFSRVVIPDARLRGSHFALFPSGFVGVFAKSQLRFRGCLAVALVSLSIAAFRDSTRSRSFYATDHDQPPMSALCLNFPYLAGFSARANGLMREHQDRS